METDTYVKIFIPKDLHFNRIKTQSLETITSLNTLLFPALAIRILTYPDYFNSSLSTEIILRKG